MTKTCLYWNNLFHGDESDTFSHKIADNNEQTQVEHIHLEMNQVTEIRFNY